MTSNQSDGLQRLFGAANAALELIGHAWGRTEQLVAEVRRDYQAIAADGIALYSAAAGFGRDVSDGARATPRGARAATKALQIVASYRIAAARAELADPDEAKRQREALHAKNAQRLYDLCVDAGGGLLKVGQLLSCRADLLPQAFVTSLSRLQDQVPPADPVEIAALLTEELGAPIETLFADFDVEPMAAASLAQVHAATLLDGRRVAIKIQRPNVDALIKSDIILLRMIGGRLAELAPHLPIETITEELIRTLDDELDFRHEAQSLARFADNFHHNEQIISPAVVDALSTRRVLTMTRVDGHRLTEFLDSCEALGADGVAGRETIFGLLVDSYCQQILADGFFHADPHPGNFLVCTGKDEPPRLAFLDFGCTQSLGDEARSGYANISVAILKADAETLADSLSAIGFSSSDRQALVELADGFMTQLRSQLADLAAIDPHAELQRAIALAQAYPLVEVPQSFVMLGRVFAALGGLFLRYQPETQLFAIVASHLGRTTRSVKTA